MRTILLVFAIAFIALPLSAQQEAAPPAVQKDAGRDQVQDQNGQDQTVKIKTRFLIKIREKYRSSVRT